MLRILNVSLCLDYENDDLINIASKRLGISKKYIDKVSIYKKSIDARRKKDIHLYVL